MRKAFLPLFLACVAVFSVSTASFSQGQTAASSTYRGDINEDGQVNIFDLLQLIKIIGGTQEQTERTGQIADIDESGSVSILDLLSLIRVISGTEVPGIIYWEPAIAGLSRKALDW